MSYDAVSDHLVKDSVMNTVHVGWLHTVTYVACKHLTVKLN